MFALDPGVTTGWAILKRDLSVIGMGDLAPEELGSALDLLVRSMHRLDKMIIPVVEDVPNTRGMKSSLTRTLEFVNRTIDHWLVDVFELPVIYVPPSRWKTSRVVVIQKKKKIVQRWNGMKTSQHMKDAYMLACYQAQNVES